MFSAVVLIRKIDVITRRRVMHRVHLGSIEDNKDNIIAYATEEQNPRFPLGKWGMQHNE